MSGHSKWSSIKHKKAATDKKRGNLFSKLSRAIMVAVREGGPNPVDNLALQNAIEKARAFSMPKDTIERAIERASGAGDSAAFETVVYEGYGPGGTAVLVEALTDNRNRTASNVRTAFNRAGGSLGQSGSVAFLFDRKGVISLAGEADEDEVMLAAAEADADDVESDDGVLTVICEPTALARVRGVVAAAGFAIESAEIRMVPKTVNTVDDETAAKLMRLVEALEDDDDVQEVFFNFEIPDSLLDETG
jgi:YebC/PmpR family DNA-binding regulatory protein